VVHTVTLIPGDGIGPDLTDSVKEVIGALDVDIEWEVAEAGETVMEKEGTPLPESVLESIRRNKVALKGPLTTPVGTGFRSVNVALRKELDLYANIRPSLSLPGLDLPYKNIDIVIYRENTEDLYAGVEHMVGKHAAESIKIITREGTERICRMAFERSREQGRKHITVVHKANIMKYTDGLFRDVFFEVAKDYENDFEEIDDRIVDNMCMQLVMKPNLYDVLVCPNLYGDILSDLCAGLTGGLGVGGEHRGGHSGLRAGARFRTQVRRPKPGQPARHPPLGEEHALLPWLQRRGRAHAGSHRGCAQEPRDPHQRSRRECRHQGVHAGHRLEPVGSGIEWGLCERRSEVWCASRV
jgi:isocitrate dehydrogenase (NAD+)